jgi:hypothetical protein
MGARDRRRKAARGKRRYYLIAAVVVLLVAAIALVALLPHGAPATTSTATPETSGTTSQAEKPVILYINQGNGAVNQTNFGSMLSFALSQGFNTIFFQVYRSGTLLFTPGELTTFVAEAHVQHLKLFFTIYLTNSSQQIPTAIYPLGEDGISLDMSTLPFASEEQLFSELQQGYQGTNAITTTDMTLPLSPDMLILETYGTQYQQYIHAGIIASVGVFTTTSNAEYQQEFQYALKNSDGVMVFDYAGLMKSGY